MAHTGVVHVMKSTADDWCGGQETRPSSCSIKSVNKPKQRARMLTPCETLLDVPAFWLH